VTPTDTAKKATGAWKRKVQQTRGKKNKKANEFTTNNSLQRRKFTMRPAEDRKDKQGN